MKISHLNFKFLIYIILIGIFFFSVYSSLISYKQSSKQSLNLKIVSEVVCLENEGFCLVEKKIHPQNDDITHHLNIINLLQNFPTLLKFYKFYFTRISSKLLILSFLDIIKSRED